MYIIVVKAVQSKNHVFTDSLFCDGWVGFVSSAYTVLTDSNIPVNPEIPYVFGNVLGFGVPSQGSSGFYRGSYSSANQVLAAMTLDSARWKFQYDFTPTQANGAIGTIGLTHQYQNVEKKHFSGITCSSSSPGYQNTCDGRYSYVCSTAGIITIYDLWLNTSVQHDISALVGTASGEYKTVGYAPLTGKFYVYVYSSTAANRKMHVFSDNTFAALENTYSTSNVTLVVNNMPIYIYGASAFCGTSTAGVIAEFDFVNNTEHILHSNPHPNNPIIGRAIQETKNGSSCFDRYIFCGWSTSQFSSSCGGIFDTGTRDFIGTYTGPHNYSYSHSLIKHPLASIYCTNYNNFAHNNAIAAYVFPEPIVKTDAYGMTATYELEVFWN